MINDPESGATSEPLISSSDGNDDGNNSSNTEDGRTKKDIATFIVSLFMTIGSALLLGVFWPKYSYSFDWISRKDPDLVEVLLITGALLILIGYFIEDFILYPEGVSSSFADNDDESSYHRRCCDTIGLQGSVTFFVAMICLASGTSGPRNDLAISVLLILSGIAFGWHHHTKLYVIYKKEKSIIAIGMIACILHGLSAVLLLSSGVVVFTTTHYLFKTLMFVAILMKVIGSFLESIDFLKKCRRG